MNAHEQLIDQDACKQALGPGKTMVGLKALIKHY